MAHASIIGDLGIGYPLIKDQALAYHSLGVDDNTCPDNTTATYSRIQNMLRLRSGRTAGRLLHDRRHHNIQWNDGTATLILVESECTLPRIPALLETRL